MATLRRPRAGTDEDRMSAPSMLPVPPSEPAYVQKLRYRLRSEISLRRDKERELMATRLELARVKSRLHHALRART